MTTGARTKTTRDRQLLTRPVAAVAITALGLLGTPVWQGCGGGDGTSTSARGQASTSGGDTAEAGDDPLLPLGGCDQETMNSDVKLVRARALPWSYATTHEATVMCEAKRLIVRLGASVTVAVSTVRDEAGTGTLASEAAPGIVQVLGAAYQQLAPDARLSAERRTRLGERDIPAHCGRVDFTVEDNAVVAHVCAAWLSHQGYTHMIQVLISDAAANLGTSVQEVDGLIGGMVNGLVLTDVPE